MSDMPDHNPRGSLGSALSSDEADLYEALDREKSAGGDGGDGSGEGAALKNERFAGVAAEGLADVLAGATLSAGAHGPAVKQVQHALVDMGFALPGGADGAYGRQTTKAIRNFQINASKAFSAIKPTGNLDAATLRALDELAPPPGQKGQSKNIPAPFFDGKKLRVVVLKDEHRTFLFDRSGKLSGIFMNAVGAAATSTGEGLKFVASKLDEPDAIATGERLWGGPVFGVRIVDLSWADGKRSGEELHGTVSPGELGEDVSHGCVRHSNPDIITIFDSLNVGDKVAIVAGLSDPRLHA